MYSCEMRDSPGRGLLVDALAQHFGGRLQVDDQVGRRQFGGEALEIALVQLQFFVVEVEVGEDLVLLEQEIGDQRARRFGREGVAQALVALVQEIHLRAKRRAGFFAVKIGQKGIVLAVQDAARVHAVGQKTRQRRFADAQRPFHGNVARDRKRRRFRGRLGSGTWHGPRDYSRKRLSDSKFSRVTRALRLSDCKAHGAR